MATTTTNYGLTKPAGTDKYDISVFNSNADKIDAQMKANANAAATAKSTADGKQNPIVAGTGISVASDGKTINHSNSVTPQTSYVGDATAVPRLKFDAQGHITGVSTATIYPPTSAGSAGQVWVSNGSGAGTWKNKTLKFIDVSASSWTADTEFSDYEYKCTIPLTGVTSSDYSDVIFNVTEATSGNYAPISRTYDGGVYIWGKVNDAITVNIIVEVF